MQMLRKIAQSISKCQFLLFFGKNFFAFWRVIQIGVEWLIIRQMIRNSSADILLELFERDVFGSICGHNLNLKGKDKAIVITSDFKIGSDERIDVHESHFTLLIPLFYQLTARTHATTFLEKRFLRTSSSK